MVGGVYVVTECGGACMPHVLGGTVCVLAWVGGSCRRVTAHAVLQGNAGILLSRLAALPTWVVSTRAAL